ncbi:hypothetical protein Agabi119p4_11273 [Agaricus bisporus var. burnettii]|uniref:Protein kinase domain-containing protein n=1 Tax=Agaricus bisporus var. burnettii TaxID=192524 RepID=A0A8H7C1J1_AGABI|nr:hypothetical protein Agabi119p4_11273 [Agaricus bisporus var. burnettii]
MLDPGNWLKCSSPPSLVQSSPRISSSSSVVSLMDDTIPIPFPFPLLDNDDADLNERIAFWDSPSTINWFRQRGYTLYVRNEFADQPWYSEPALGCKHPSEMQYPYPHYGSEVNSKTPLRALDLSASSSGLIVTNSLSLSAGAPHPSLSTLAGDGSSERELSYSCPEHPLECQVIGVNYNARWSDVVCFPERGPIRNVIRIMQSLLKALAFLHKNNILHRDIKLDNALVSHFADDATCYMDHSMRKRLQWSNELIYCLFDFDISMMLPADTDRSRCRLSYKLAWDGSGYQPHDTIVLCMRFQHLAPHIPMLAPFLDRMVTRNIPLRFNAAQALQFFEAILPEVSEEVLNSVYHEKAKASDYEWDRWEGLPPDFIKKWESHREPPVPFSTTVLRWTFSFERMPYILPVEFVEACISVIGNPPVLG